MIHNFLTNSEIKHLTELHKVTFCGNCKYCRDTKCVPQKIIVDNNISCEKFVQEWFHSQTYPLKFME